MKKLLYLFLVSLVLLSACNKQEEEIEGQDTVPVVENQEQQQVVEAETDFVEGYTQESPEWAGFKTDIEKQSGEILSSFGVPASASDKNMIYVSTEGKYIGDYPNGKQMNKIYSYNISNKILTELYKEEADQTLRGMGREGNKLILMLDRIDNSPGPCFSIWKDWDKFAYLDIGNPQDGLKAYTVPKNLIEKGTKEQKECEAANELGEELDLQTNCQDSGGTYDIAKENCTCPTGTFVVDGKDVALYTLDKKGVCSDPMGVPGGKMGEEMMKNHPLNKE